MASTTNIAMIPHSKKPFEWKPLSDDLSKEFKKLVRSDKKSDKKTEKKGKSKESKSSDNFRLNNDGFYYYQKKDQLVPVISEDSTFIYLSQELGWVAPRDYQLAALKHFLASGENYITYYSEGSKVDKLDFHVQLPSDLNVKKNIIFSLVRGKHKNRVMMVRDTLAHCNGNDSMCMFLSSQKYVPKGMLIFDLINKPGDNIPNILVADYFISAIIAHMKKSDDKERTKVMKLLETKSLEHVLDKIEKTDK